MKLLTITVIVLYVLALSYFASTAAGAFDENFPLSEKTKLLYSVVDINSILIGFYALMYSVFLVGGKAWAVETGTLIVYTLIPPAIFLSSILISYTMVGWLFQESPSADFWFIVPVGVLLAGVFMFFVMVARIVPRIFFRS